MKKIKYSKNEKFKITFLAIFFFLFSLLCAIERVINWKSRFGAKKIFSLRVSTN